MLLPLSKKLQVEYPSCCNVGGGSLLFGFPSPKPIRFISYPYLSNPSAVMSARNPLVAACVVSAYCRIKIIFAFCCVAKVFPAIVSSIAIPVINAIFWPSSGYNQKNYSMKIVSSCLAVLREGYAAISVEIVCASYGAFSPTLTAPNFPSAYAGFFVVGKLRSNECRSKIVAWVSQFCLLTAELVRGGEMFSGVSSSRFMSGA